MNLKQRVVKLETQINIDKPDTRFTVGTDVWEGQLQNILDNLRPTLGPPGERTHQSQGYGNDPVLVHVQRGESVKDAKARVCNELGLNGLEDSDFFIWEALT